MKFSVDVVSKSYSFDSLLFLKQKSFLQPTFLAVLKIPVLSLAAAQALCTQNLHGGLLTILISMSYSFFICLFLPFTFLFPS
ncbi:hypothetical protein wVul_0321 [Wolbachia endosymbiont of Armadillidium vulgare str. wVulC]|nr:hypothetical protein wVul_0321 [Wolbachia endosymbiont of Armadillidium vulgare str. wVulC]